MLKDSKTKAREIIEQLGYESSSTDSFHSDSDFDDLLDESLENVYYRDRSFASDSWLSASDISEF